MEERLAVLQQKEEEMQSLQEELSTLEEIRYCKMSEILYKCILNNLITFKWNEMLKIKQNY